MVSSWCLRRRSVCSERLRWRFWLLQRREKRELLARGLRQRCPRPCCDGAGTVRGGESGLGYGHVDGAGVAFPRVAVTRVCGPGFVP